MHISGHFINMLKGIQYTTDKHEKMAAVNGLEQLNPPRDKILTFGVACWPDRDYNKARPWRWFCFDSLRSADSDTVIGGNAQYPTNHEEEKGFIVMPPWNTWKDIDGQAYDLC